MDLRFPINCCLRKCVIAFVIFLSLTEFANCQTYVKSVDAEAQSSNDIKILSPTAAAFAEYVVNPVGYYTGVPSISVPIYDVKLKDFTLPISLDYHSGGIKIEEVSSNVGLGWTLNAGGMITRAVKDKPDDASIEFCDDSWVFSAPGGPTPPPIAVNNRCGNGLLWAKGTSPNANFDGLTTYDINLNGFNGDYNSATYSMKLLKMFYGVAVQNYANSQNIYLLSMVDKEPDIFYFNFAGGRTGEFVFDVNGATPKVRIVPYQDLKIEYTINASKKLIGFKITDEGGVIYYFNSVEESSLLTQVNYSPVDEGLDEVWHTQVRNYDPGSGVKKYHSSWFLTRIETPLKDYLDLTYVGEEHVVSNVSPQQTGLAYYNPASNANTYDPNQINSYGYHMSYIKNESTILSKRLATIENNNIRIVFGAEVKRKDLGPTAYAVDNIEISNKIGTSNRVKKLKLRYDYFYSDSTTYSQGIKYRPTKYPENYQFAVQDSMKYYKRLRLRSVTEFGQTDSDSLQPYRFDYKYFDFTNNANHRLPHRLSYRQDAWGYYNGAVTNKTLIPKLYVYPTHYSPRDSRQFSFLKKNSFTGNEWILPGADRLANPSVTDIGILTKITYPTGGSTQYDFESHVFRHEGQDYSGGGLRILRVTKNDAINPASNIIYNYSYKNSDNTSSGLIISLPIFAVRHVNKSNGFFTSPSDAFAYKYATTRFSVSQASVGRTNGSFVGYRTVTEYIQNNGKKVLTYTLPASWNVQDDISIRNGGNCGINDNYCEGLYQRTPVVNIFVPLSTATTSVLDAANYDFTYCRAAPNTFPFADNPNYDWQRGHLMEEKYYDNSTNLIKEVKYVYSNYFPSGATAPVTIFGYKIANFYPLLNTGYRPAAYVFRASKYSILTDVAKMLTSKREKFYNVGDISKVYELLTTYQYGNPNHVQVTKVTMTDSKGVSNSTINEFPWDIVGNSLGSDLLRQNHIFNRIQRQTNYQGTNTISKMEIGFETISGNILPTTIVKYANGNLESSRTLLSYDANGNVVKTVQAIDSEPTGSIIVPTAIKSIIWGYNSTLPIADVVNANPNQIFHTSFEDLVETNVIETDAYTGKKCYNGTYTIPIAARPISGNYILSYWEKLGVGSWTYKTQQLTNSIPSQISSTGKIDEIRIVPVGAMMSTYTYDPLIGLTTKTDPNNKPEFFQFDKFGRLQTIRDFTGNIRTQYEYNYQIK